MKQYLTLFFNFTLRLMFFVMCIDFAILYYHVLGPMVSSQYNFKFKNSLYLKKKKKKKTFRSSCFSLLFKKQF